MTIDEAKNLIQTSDRAVMRAMVALYNLQTEAEKHTGKTTNLNGVGFSGAHSRRGTYYAKWCLSGRDLTGHHLENARKIALRYTRQLATIATNKEAQEASKAVQEASAIVDEWKKTGNIPDLACLLPG